MHIWGRSKWMLALRAGGGGWACVVSWWLGARALRTGRRVDFARGIRHGCSAQLPLLPAFVLCGSPTDAFAMRVPACRDPPNACPIEQ